MNFTFFTAINNIPCLTFLVFPWRSRIIKLCYNKTFFFSLLQFLLHFQFRMASLPWFRWISETGLLCYWNWWFSFFGMQLFWNEQDFCWRVNCLLSEKNVWFWQRDDLVLIGKMLQCAFGWKKELFGQEKSFENFWHYLLKACQNFLQLKLNGPNMGCSQMTYKTSNLFEVQTIRS